MSTTITNQKLRQLLLDLGFTSRSSVHPKCAVFQHAESGARILLPSNRDADPARQADVLSLRTHLNYQGHLEPEEFDDFLSRGVLKAS